MMSQFQHLIFVNFVDVLRVLAELDIAHKIEDLTIFDRNVFRKRKTRFTPLLLLCLSRMKL